MSSNGVGANWYLPLGSFFCKSHEVHFAINRTDVVFMVVNKTTTCNKSKNEHARIKQIKNETRPARELKKRNTSRMQRRYQHDNLTVGGVSSGVTSMII
jgi:hypothetical protein